MTVPAISVAMSVYNCERYVALAIESILAQNFGDFEFIIVDDGSTDGSAAIIDEFASKDTRIRAIHRQNKGLIFSLNQALAEARAPIIARMDADDIANPERFERQYDFLQLQPEYGVVSSWTTDIDENGDPYPIADHGHPADHEGFLEALETGTPLCHPATMYRRDLVLSVGGYHAAFKHCEDLDLWLRLSDKTRLCSLPERLMQYRRTEGQVSNRHIVEQQINGAIARLAWAERKAGRPDPTLGLTALPPLEGLDALFGRAGIAADVERRVAPGIVYSHNALSGSGFDIVLRHIKRGGDTHGMWRTVARLLRFGEPARALTLFSTLIGV